METIRIVKQKRGSAKILWFLVVFVILAAIAWLTIDSNDQFKNTFFSEQDTLENNNYSSRERSLVENQRVNLPAYVSFINRQIIPEDSVSNETKKKAIHHLRLALAEVDDMPANTRKYSVDEDDSVTNKESAVAYNRDSVKNPLSKNSTNDNSLVETGTQLIYLQKNDYPVLSKIGDKIQESIIILQKNETKEELKTFFVLSSSLLQEINSEVVKNQYVKRGNYENFK